ncbi:TLD-domain-containing protein [Zychaea mexicana]|uniref:TLD-domain-containing protein n=1 Tax=Zychaea mexicana TaxID=64656 RepID=UPI0022FEE0BB|nr:TLD-domain-containing protein [Zychaea mexicana]KAI9488067.1 TLD-domain-containing protein [Zychaea mexicana]
MGQHQSKSKEATVKNNSNITESRPSSGIGENTSTLSFGKHSTTECSSLGDRSNATLLQFKRKLKRIELYSLHQVFDELKTEYPDHFECIEAKKFLEHLNLPRSVEQGGILLFKSFSYLGSYPNCSSAVPLTFEAFLTAFVLLTGKMDDSDNLDASLFEDMFFESLAVVHSKASNKPASPTETEQEQPNTLPVPQHEKEEEKRTKGLSLADLGVSFDDLDFGQQDAERKSTADDDDNDDDDDDDSAMMLCRDLVELFTLMLYIVQMEKQEQTKMGSGDDKSVETLRRMARAMVDSMQPTSDTSSSNNDGSDSNQDQVSQRHFFAWKRRNAPYLFKTIQSFIYGKFALSGQTSLTTVSDLILPEDSVSTPDTSDILTLPYCALLCWCLPEIARRVKMWPRLYSANQDGFAMNRFERNVFRYPGPTLMVIQGEELHTNKSILIGAYISEAWKQSSRHYWGNDACFVFELWPTFQVYRSTKRNNQYIYYHDDFGIAMGGTSKSSAPPVSSSSSMLNKRHPSSSSVNFLLQLDNTLQQGVYAQEQYPSLPTFENSACTRQKSGFNVKFETIDIEVFGMGSEKARKVQEREWEFEKREAVRRAGLQFRQADGNQVDRELLRMAGIIDDDNRQER